MENPKSGTNAFMCVLCSIICLFLYISLQSSKHTPHEVMFGRKAVLPVDFNSQESYDPEESLKAFDEAPLPNLADIEAHQKEINVMKGNIEKAQAKQKEQYDEAYFGRVFCCWCIGPKKDFTRKRRGGGALDYRWLGPYAITCSLGKGLYHLADVQTGAVIHRVNGFHLKPFCGGDVEQNVTDDAKQEDIFDGELEGRFVGVKQEGGFDGARLEDGSDGESEGRFVGVEQEGGFDGAEIEDGFVSVEPESSQFGAGRWFCGAEREDGFLGMEQEDGLDELKDGHWLSCDVINRAQSLLKKQFHSRMGSSPLMC